MLRHCFRKPWFCLWRGKNVHTKTREYRTARRICVARVPGWILTTRHGLTIYRAEIVQKICIQLLYAMASGGYFGLALATLPHVERFSVLTLSEENYTT